MSELRERRALVEAQMQRIERAYFYWFGYLIGAISGLVVGWAVWG